LTSCAAVLLAGCQERITDYDLARAAMASQNVREVAPLELEEVDPNAAPTPEPNAPPPETMELSLEQCRALALENNLQLKADLIGPAIAAEALSEEEAKFEASFFANASYLKTDQPSGKVIDIGDGILVPVITPSQSERINADLGVRVPLRTGGTVTFDLADGRTEDLRNPGPFNPAYGNTFLISLSQPLLRNAGRWVNTHSIRLAAYGSQISEARAKLDVITVLAALDRVYWRLYAARRELEVRRQQYDLANAQLEQAQRLVDVGQRAPVEIIRAEAGVAQQLEAIIVAENNLRDRERELKRVVNKAGLSMQTPTVLIPATEPDPVRYELDRARVVRTAIDSRMELLELQLQLLQDASNVDFARNQTLPVAALNYSYNINATGAERSDSWDLLLDNNFADHRVGLQVVIPLGNEAAKSRLRQAIYARRQRLASRADRERVIELEVLNAVDQVEANWQRILAARQTTILNARVYEAEKRQFEQGQRTSTEVLDAQTNFANAQSAEIQALAEYQIALVDLAYATGTLLGAARIQWEPLVPATDVR
jgi:outer membrane protein TolC